MARIACQFSVNIGAGGLGAKGPRSPEAWRPGDRGRAVLDLFPELSTREREILQLLTEGLKNAEIARRLSLSSKTVRNNVSNILSKMQVADRTEAAIRALEAGVSVARRPSAT